MSHWRSIIPSFVAENMNGRCAVHGTISMLGCGRLCGQSTVCMKRGRLTSRTTRAQPCSASSGAARIPTWRRLKSIPSWKWTVGSSHVWERGNWTADSLLREYGFTWGVFARTLIRRNILQVSSSCCWTIYFPKLDKIIQVKLKTL